MLFKNQNCEKIENNTNLSLQKNADFKDQGYYTCMFLFHHNGKLFNATVTHNVTVGGKRNFRIGKKQMYLSKTEYFLSSKAVQEARGSWSCDHIMSSNKRVKTILAPSTTLKDF